MSVLSLVRFSFVTFHRNFLLNKEPRLMKLSGFLLVECEEFEKLFFTSSTFDNGTLLLAENLVGLIVLF